MGIDWMNRPELAQAIPPVYTEFVGGELTRHLTAVSA
jgi:DNA (cytosine-5)-methyltransferase 1